jgi:hypothetical protein
MGNYQTSGYFITKDFSAVEGPEYNYHPDYNQSLRHSDYTYFYAGILICFLIAAILVVYNIVLGCCSPWKKYWNSNNTGNRLILPLFIKPPKDQRPIL